MKKVLVATNIRGFFKELLDNDFNNFKFYYDESASRDRVSVDNSRIKMKLYNFRKSRFGDFIGFVQRVKPKTNDCDYYLSFNRFLKTKKDYVIVLESPMALTHYSLYRNKTFFGNRRIRKYFNYNKNVKIVCMSNACKNTLEHFLDIPKDIEVYQIYPLIKRNRYVDEEKITKRSNKLDLKCLYISSRFNLKGGKDILKAFEKLRELSRNNIKLTIITQLDLLPEETKRMIKSNKNIELFDYDFNREELRKIYAKSDILLNPTRQDSIPLVVLEALKSGNVILSTDLYAIPEIVQNDVNGFLCEPKYRYYYKNNLPNEKIWKNTDETIKSDYIDEKIVEFLIEKIILLDDDRQKLTEMALSSLEISENSEFSEESIKEKWETIFCEKYDEEFINEEK